VRTRMSTFMAQALSWLTDSSRSSQSFRNPKDWQMEFNEKQISDFK
jgi:hypothetical protein